MPEGELFISLLGWAATVLASICFLPQAYRVYKARSAKGLSFATFSLLLTTNVLWLTYGMAIDNIPLIANNVFAISANGLIMGFFIKEKFFNAASSDAVLVSTSPRAFA